MKIPLNLSGAAIAVGMLVASNMFMTFAWYWHLKLQKPGESSWPMIAIILTSWLIALVEYIILIPANRIGSAAGLNVAQLKIIQEVVTVCVFVPFMLLFMGERWRWDYLLAFVCMIGAVYFVNRGRLDEGKSPSADAAGQSAEVGDCRRLQEVASE